MSAKPRLAPGGAPIVNLPHVTQPEAVPPQSFPMSPQEALAFGRLLAQREQIEGALQGVLAQAKARLGLAVEAKVEIDLGGAVYRVRG